MADLISNKEILQEIVNFLNKGNVFVTRKDKKIVPECIDDLPPSIRLSRGDMYKRAYQRLYHKLKKSENPTYKNDSKLIREGKVKEVRVEPIIKAATINATKASTNPTVVNAVKKRTDEILRVKMKGMVVSINSKTQSIEVDFM